MIGVSEEIYAGVFRSVSSGKAMKFHIQDMIESNVEGGAETTSVARVMFRV
jgi:hypothetical protein